MSEGWIVLGKITRARGIKGELVLVPWSDKLDRFSELKEVVLEGEEKVSYHVTLARRHQGKILLQLDGIASRTQAETKAGRLVYIPQTELVPLNNKDEFYIHDLVGLEVYTEDKEYLGLLETVLTNPGNDIFSVRAGEKLYYAPATKEAVVEIDLGKKRVILRKTFVVEQ